jgi:hypothetical protein
MKYIFLAVSLLVLSACGGGKDKKTEGSNELPENAASFTLQNIRFDATDYYEGEQVTVTKGTSFEVQWVSPTSAPYIIDLHLSTSGAVHSDSNKIVELKCGSASFSLCPNATAEVQCEIDDNKLSCFIGSDYLGSVGFQEQELSKLKFIIKGCDALSNCDVKTFNLSVQNKTG